MPNLRYVPSVKLPTTDKAPGSRLLKIVVGDDHGGKASEVRLDGAAHEQKINAKLRPGYMVTAELTDYDAEGGRIGTYSTDATAGGNPTPGEPDPGAMAITFAAVAEPDAEPAKPAPAPKPASAVNRPEPAPEPKAAT